MTPVIDPTDYIAARVAALNPLPLPAEELRTRALRASQQAKVSEFAARRALERKGN